MFAREIAVVIITAATAKFTAGSLAPICRRQTRRILREINDLETRYGGYEFVTIINGGTGELFDASAPIGGPRAAMCENSRPFSGAFHADELSI